MIAHRLDDGTVRLEWEPGETECVVSREVLEAMTLELNSHRVMMRALSEAVRFVREVR